MRKNNNDIIHHYFYLDAHKIGPWHVVLHQEPWSIRTEISEYGEFINSIVYVLTLELEALLHPHRSYQVLYSITKSSISIVVGLDGCGRDLVSFSKHSLEHV